MSSAHTPPSPSHIPSLDGFRAVSILIVLLGHADVSRLIPGGFGVTVFFFLSGFLITTLLTREYDKHGSISLKAFYLRRLLRLGPPLLLTMAAAMTLAWLGLTPGALDPLTALSQIFFFYNYYALIPGIESNVVGLGILWSLSVEEHFYLIWPAMFIAWATGLMRMPHMLALLVAILIWRFIRFIWFGDTEWTIYISTDTRFDSLLYGCLLALIHWKGLDAKIFPRNTAAIYAILAIAGAMLLLAFIWREPMFRSTLRYTLQGIALIPIFHYAIKHHEMIIFRPLNWHLVRQIGIWSYTIYLCHYVVIYCLREQGFAPDQGIIFAVVVLAISSAWAALVYEFGEKPLHPMRRRMTGHPKAGAQPQ